MTRSLHSPPASIPYASKRQCRIHYTSTHSTSAFSVLGPSYVLILDPIPSLQTVRSSASFAAGFTFPSTPTSISAIGFPYNSSDGTTFSIYPSPSPSTITHPPLERSTYLAAQH